MLRYKVGSKGIIGFFEVWFVPLFIGIPAAFVLWIVVSGLAYCTSSIKMQIEVMMTAGLISAAVIAAEQMNLWLVISDDDIRLKYTKPIDFTIWCHSWSEVVSVRVWSDKIPSDPHAVIKRIIIRRPFGRNPDFHIGKNIAEIRQLMDFINTKIPDKVVWEVQ